MEARWNVIAEVLGLKDPQSNLERCRETICYAISSKIGENPGAQLLVARGDFQIVQWTPATEQPTANKPMMRLLDYPNSPAPKWVPHYLEFDASSTVTERFEVLDVQFHQPSETRNP